MCPRTGVIKRKISIVMGEAVVAMDIRRLLEILGYDVTAEIFREEPAAVDVVDRPDRLLVDTSLPGGTDSYHLARRLTGEGAIPVIFLISRFGRDVIERVEGLPYCGFVTKPVTEGELYTSIRTLLHQYDTDRRLRESEAAYRTLFDQSALPIWETDASGVMEYIRGPGAPSPRGMRAHLEEHPAELARCLRLIAVREVNDAAVELFGAAEREELRRALPALFRDYAVAHLTECFAAVAEGLTRLESSALCTTLDGGMVSGRVRYSVVPGHEKDLGRVLCQFISSQETRRTG
jgi:CheY-like chemotaxis protein